MNCSRASLTLFSRDKSSSKTVWAHSKVSSLEDIQEQAKLLSSKKSNTNQPSKNLRSTGRKYLQYKCFQGQLEVLNNLSEESSTNSRKVLLVFCLLKISTYFLELNKFHHMRLPQLLYSHRCKKYSGKKQSQQLRIILKDSLLEV